MTFAELSVPKKVLHGNHNTVTFRNYNHFDDCEFINDGKSNDLLNGNCKEVKLNEWKDAFLHISNSHAPTKNRPVEGEIQYLHYTRYYKNYVW